ncbi:MAG: amino acid permease, partial [Acidobacteria bacterium]|nr:amino acid permease [Acidobacteriota bacterium]
SASRTVYSLARDHGTPFAGHLSWVSPKHGTPAPAIWAMVAASFAAMIWSGAVPIVTSLSTVALYIAYGIPLALAWRARRSGSGWPQEAVWNLGRWGEAVNLIAIVFCLFVCVMLVMPPNELAGKTLAGLLALLLVLYAAVARRRYKGPEWSLARHQAAPAPMSKP